MGFMSYHLKYYYDALLEFETGVATADTIYKAKQLLKILDDLEDEGYTVLCEKLEEAFHGVSRLRKYLQLNHVEPFKLCSVAAKESSIVYGEADFELTEAIKNVVQKAGDVKVESEAPFLQRLICFCEWIGYEEHTAYVFLLRDAMLPFIYYQSKGRSRIHPWLLSRKSLKLLAGCEGVDDEIRASIIDALEFGKYKDFSEFCAIVFSGIRKTLSKYPEVENSLRELLNEISEKRIIVIESGCSGTFPMLLMCMDSRVDMRMYTTYPYLADVYSDKIFTPQYEENRLFETLCSQNLYFRFSGFSNKRFYVNTCNDKDVEAVAMREIKTMHSATRQKRN